MQLRNARLCLDCEELHEDPQCPLCASESFAFLSRWVPAEERRRAKRGRQKVESQAPAVVPSPRNNNWIAGGLAGVALIAASRWLFRSDRVEPGSPASPAPPPAADPSVAPEEKEE
jgi:hypothetical protein